MSGASPTGLRPSAGLAEQYRAARDGALVADRPDVEVLLVAGRDAADLLHRLSTNAIKGLREGQGAATVFTTAKGRILDLVTVHRTAEGLVLLCAAGRGRAVREWIERYTFREQVSVEDRGATHGVFGVCGARSGALTRSAWGAADLPLHGVTPIESDGRAGLLVRSWPLGGEGYLVVAPRASLEALRLRALGGALAGGVPSGGGVEGGAGLGAPGVVVAGSACLEILRVEAGLPAAGRELTEEHNPWEARLQDAIALDKGCYVGQEVIARLNTYNKVARLLVRLSAAAGAGNAAAAAGIADAAGGNDAFPPGAAIRDGAPIGSVTSSALVPDGAGRALALGYVRDEDATPGRPVEIVWPGGHAPATIDGVAR